MTKYFANESKWHRYEQDTEIFLLDCSEGPDAIYTFEDSFGNIKFLIGGEFYIVEDD